MTTNTAEVRPVNLSSIVAANVRAFAAVRGWTQSDMASRMGMAKVTMSDRYRERTPWTVDELAKVADLFGIEVGDLLARPKGFEPLTFWLGADHTMTVLAVASGLGEVIFCDECGWRGAVWGAAVTRECQAHGRRHHWTVERAASRDYEGPIPYTVICDSCGSDVTRAGCACKAGGPA